MEPKIHQEADDFTPFQEGVNVNLFFPGAQRRQILDDIKENLLERAAVLTITGEEGTGKSMLCRMLEKELPPELCCVYLPTNLESFDDVIRILSLKLETESAEEPESTAALVEEILTCLKESERRLVVVFDQAERMYLATIERLRKLLDHLNDEEVVLQLVFAGRRSLRENLEQLAICDFETTKERHFRLHPLGLSETYAYLNHCAKRGDIGASKNIFTPDVVKKIFNMAQGNLRMTNILAAKSVDSANSEASFMILLDSVEKETLTYGTPKKRKKWLPSDILTNWKTFAGVALGLVVVALIFILNGGEEKTETVERERMEIRLEEQTIEQEETIAAVEPLEKEQPGQPEETSRITPQEVPGHESAAAAPGGTSQEELEGEATPATKEKESRQEQSTSTVGATVDKEAEEAPTKEEIEVESPEKPSEKIRVAETEVQTDPATQEGAAEAQVAASSPAETSDGEQESSPGGTMAGQSAEAPRLEEQGAREDSAPPGQPELASHKAVEQTASPVSSKGPGELEEGEEQAAAPLEDQGIPELDTEGKQPPTMEDRQLMATVEPSASGRQSGEEAREETIAETDEPPVLSGRKKEAPIRKVSITAAKKVFPIARAQVDDAAAVSSETAVDEDVDSIYGERIAAGSRWLAQPTEDGHTIQLMALTAETAEKNLRARFGRRQYLDIADNLYVIKDGQNTTVFVYYGEYADIGAAKTALASMPTFLQKHDPFVISIAEVQRKITEQQ